MKVIYDISVLGAGYYTERSRTGIARVIENLAFHLEDFDEIDMKYCAFQSPWCWLQTKNYFEQKLSHGNGSFIYSDDKIFSLFLKKLKYIYPKPQSDIKTAGLIKICNLLIGLLNIAAESFGNPYKGFSQSDLEKADIFHSPFLPFPEQIKRNNKLKKIITVYDLIPVLFPKFFQDRENVLIPNVLKSIDNETWVTCISHATKNDLCNYLPSLDSSRVTVTHLAASSLFYPCYDPAKIEVVKTKFDLLDGPYVLSLSTLEPRKNITQTIKCFSRLIEDEAIDDLSLVLVGTKGWNFNPIFNEIKANPKIRERIVVTGYVDDEYLAPLYSGAMMFVYPSFYEGFGLPPLEAMQCGIPVITSNTSSLPEVVGEAGIMVDPTDEDALCQAMLTIYNSTEVRKKMSGDSLAQASRFSWEKCADQIMDTYKSAITK